MAGLANSNIVADLKIDNLNTNLKNLENELNEFFIEPYPYEEIKNLIRQLLKINKKLYLNIDEIKNLVIKKGSIEDIDDKIILYTGLLQYIHSLFGLIKMAQQSNIPNSIVYLVDNLTINLKDDAIFIVVPSYTHNFYYIELKKQLKQKFINIIDDMDDIFSKDDKKSVLLIYPYIYNNNISIITILAHEIGHYIEFNNDSINKLISNIHFDPKEIENIAKKQLEVNKEKGTSDHYFDLDTMKAVIHKEAQDIMKNWLQELFCDLIGFKLIGPMYLIINTEFLLSIGKSTILYPKHPSIEMRLKYLFDTYGKSGFNTTEIKEENIKEYKKYLEDIKKYIDSIKITLEPHTISKIAYEKAKSVINLLQEDVNDVIKPLNIEYKPDVYIKETEILVKKLSNLVLPCEIEQGKPANIVSILNSSNIFKILLSKKIFETQKDGLAMSFLDFQYQIDQFVARSVELSTIHQKFLKFEGEINECKE